MRAARPSRAAMGGGNLFALDFDGIFYDSYGQSSLSAVKAAKVRWSWVFEQVAAAMEEWMVEQMHPVLVAKPTPEATQRQSHSRTCAPSAPATIVGGQGLLLPLMFWPDLCFGSLGVPFSISCSSIVPYDLHMSHGRRSVLFIA